MQLSYRVDREVTYDDADCSFSFQTVTDKNTAFSTDESNSFDIFQWALSVTPDTMEKSSCVFREY